jgi:hypothetical protein
MGRRLIIVCTLSLFTALASWAQESAEGELVAEGTGKGMNEAEALMAAKRDAVEKGIGMILLSRTEVENFQLKRDQVVTKTLGAVKDYEILAKGQSAEGGWECTIKATLSRTTLHDDLAAFHILLESMEKPKVMVIVTENNVGNDEPVNRAAESAIIKFLKDPYDFELVDPSVVASIRSSEAKMARIAGDAAAAAQIASAYGAQVVIVGDAIGRVAEGLSQNLGGMKSVQADVTLRAINCATGRIIAAADAHGAQVHISPNTAGTKAIAKAATKASENLLDAVIEDWNKLLNNGMQLAVTVQGVTTFRTKNAVVQTLRSISGVSAVRERGWNSTSNMLQADVQYKGNANGFATQTDGYKMSMGGGSLAITGLEGTRVGIAVQVK